MKNEKFEYRYATLLKFVRNLRNRKLTSHIVLYFFLIFTCWFFSLILLIGFDSVVYLTRPWRIFLRVLFYIIPVFFVFPLIKNVKRVWKVSVFTDFIETIFPVLKGRLFTSLECSPDDPLFSSSLVNANLQDTTEIFHRLPKNPIIADVHKKIIRILYSLIILILLLFTIFPDPSMSLFTRFLFEKSFVAPSFFVFPGNGYVEKGKSITIRLESFEGRVTSPRIVIQDNVRFLKEKGGSRFETEVENVTSSFSYCVEFSDTFSPEYRIDVVELPNIKDIKFTLHYPPYTEEKDFVTSDFDLYALKGTEIEISGISNDSLKKATLMFSDSAISKLQAIGKSFEGDFEVDTSKSFTLNLVSNRGLKNADKPLFHIFTLSDEYPSIEISSPGENINLPQELVLKLVMDVRDDYGISKVQLVWEKEKEKHTMQIAKNLGDRDATIEYGWDLLSISIFPGDSLRYYVLVYDNDIVSGPKMTKSKTYEIRFPTATDIYKEIASEGERAQEAFETESYEMEKVKQGLLKLEKSLKKTKKLSWEEKKKALEILKKEKELVERVEETRKNMQKIAEKINDAFLSNPEIKEKLKEIERLMKEIETEEIRKSIDKLKKSIENLDRKAMLESMQRMLASQEEIKKALERTVEMLKRIEQEERYKRIVEAAKKLEGEQEEVNKEMKGKQQEKLRDMKEMEKNIAEKLSDLEKEMQELATELGKGDSISKSALENAREMAAQVSEDLEKTQKAMDQGNKQSSISSGEKVQSSLSKMSSMLSEGLSSMMGERSEEVTRMLNSIIDDVILLSVKTEKVKKQIQERKNNTDELLSHSAAIKSGIERTLENVEELKSKDPFIPPIVDDELMRVVSNIVSSMGNIERNNITLASRYARSTMQTLNNVALTLIESKQNMPSSGGGSMAQLMQKLQSLSSGQMQVNQGTQSLIPLDLSSGSVPDETRRQLQSLSELQGSLAERLNQVGEGVEKEGGNILGDLSKIAEEMREVAKKLGGYNANRELVERQERILSRMLDAQRSIHKREFSKKRVAERPGEYERRNPLPLPKNPGEKKGIKKDILKELKEKYPLEYKDFIRAYFDKLLKEEKNHK